MASLDRSHKREILPYLEALHRHTPIPIFYMTHDSEELARIADHLLFIERGELLASGPLDEMLTRVDLPMARDVEAGAVLEATVASKDEQFYLAELAFAGGSLTVQWTDRPIGSRVRLRVQARDISLTLARSTGTSILNHLPARIVELSAHGRGRMLVKLDVGGALLLARITQKSAAQLDLQPGKSVFAQIKGAALLT
jgi:molybdate transport system ATP-binding protein